MCENYIRSMFVYVDAGDKRECLVVKRRCKETHKPTRIYCSFLFLSLSLYVDQKILLFLLKFSKDMNERERKLFMTR